MGSAPLTRVPCRGRGGGSSVGRAPGCGPGGRGFESRPPPSRLASALCRTPRVGPGPGKLRAASWAQSRDLVPTTFPPCPARSGISRIGRMEGVAPARRWTLVAVCATTFMLLVDITIVNVALPSIQQRLHASLTGLQWVVDAYAVTLAALILMAGALADRYGRRLVFASGVVVFSVASFLCGAAWNVATLHVARALQGVGGAALFATALALIGAEYRGPERFHALAVWGATIGAAVASGPLIGGILTDG